MMAALFFPVILTWNHQVNIALYTVFFRQSKCLCFVLRVFELLIFCIVFLVVFEEPEDPGARSFFSEIISSISDVRFSHNGRYMLTRDYLTVKVWDLNMENKPMEVYNVHDYLRSKLCSLYENDCIFDKFECVWNGNDGYVMALLLFTFFFVNIFLLSECSLLTRNQLTWPHVGLSWVRGLHLITQHVQGSLDYMIAM